MRQRRVAAGKAWDGDTPVVADPAPRRGRRHRPDRRLYADPQGRRRRIQAGPLLDQVAGPVASFTGDGAYDQDRVYASVTQRHPEATVVVPPRSTAVPSDAAETAPTQRDRHLQHIAEYGRMAWQKRSGYNARARVEATMSRWKQVSGDGLRAHTDERRATEVEVAVHALNRMLELGRPSYVRIA